MPNSDAHSLTEWLTRLEQLHPTNIELGLDRIRRVAKTLSIPDKIDQANIQITTVAGTNGKGSCVAMLENLLRHSNQSVGTYTSPHFLTYNERIKVNGKPVEDADIVRAFQQIETARGDISLTYFEFGTLAAFLIFLEKKVSCWVLEVGLGGRLDAVNLVDSNIAVVTSIDLDHQDWLGNDRELIGREKAGVFRRHKPGICVDENPPKTLLDYANDIQTKLILANNQLSWCVQNNHWDWCGLDDAGNTIAIKDLPIPNLPLPSVAAAIQAFTLLGNIPNQNELSLVLKSAALTGRFQTLHIKENPVVLDVAHNPAAAAYLAKKLSNQCEFRNIILFAAMADKEIDEMVANLNPVIHEWNFVLLPSVPRAGDEKSYSDIINKFDLQAPIFNSIGEGLESIVSRVTQADRIVVCGSFYTVADALQWLENKSGGEAKNG